MKANYLICLSLLSLILFPSCEDDATDSIAGDYKITLMSQSNCPSGQDDFELDFTGDGCDSYIGVELCANGTMILTSDGKVTTNNLSISSELLGDIFAGQFGTSGTYTENGNTVTICFGTDCDDFTRNGDKLIFTDADEGCTIRTEFTKE